MGRLYLVLEHFHHPKGDLVPISHHSPFPTPAPGNHWSTLLLICLFRTFHINGIIHYMAFCVWLLSAWCSVGSPMLQHARAPFLVTAQYCSIVWNIIVCITFCLLIHLLMDICVGSVFWWLWLEWTHTYKDLFEHLFSILLSRLNFCPSTLVLALGVRPRSSTSNSPDQSRRWGIPHP